MLCNENLLRYRVSNIHQLVNCKSNTSRKLHIRVADFFNNYSLSGTKISVEHDVFGTLFCYVVQATGELVKPVRDDYSDDVLSVSQIMLELARWGFLIDYHPNKDLSSSQLEYLSTLSALGYDKIRVIHPWKTVNGEKQSLVMVVGFKSEYLSMWLNNAYQPSYTEVSQALMDGFAINLTEISRTKKYRWDWLDFVGSIDDILADSSDDDYDRGDHA